ncbi:hypothetical protein KIN20_019965 [Parelaphostrongylus tenuis]|uniref:Uncharacterized protein n=1 Tax=Parelaphostrongylus tenuis TaxID=148309 RepID=A0AAD5N5G4_PARTN|nr:hypothetical protein KIN20_019965 [Parelaphostrongylus tenuis]
MFRRYFRTNLSPNLDSTKNLESSIDGYISPRSRRLSIELEESPTTNAEDREKEVEAGSVQTGFLKVMWFFLDYYIG